MDRSKTYRAWEGMKTRCRLKNPAHPSCSGVKGVLLCGNRWQATAKANLKSVNLYSGYDFFAAVCARKSWDAVNIKGN